MHRRNERRQQRICGMRKTLNSDKGRLREIQYKDIEALVDIAEDSLEADKIAVIAAG